MGREGRGKKEEGRRKREARDSYSRPQATSHKRKNLPGNYKSNIESGIAVSFAAGGLRLAT
jgi:hypothetical protein